MNRFSFPMIVTTKTGSAQEIELMPCPETMQSITYHWNGKIKSIVFRSAEDIIAIEKSFTANGDKPKIIVEIDTAEEINAIAGYNKVGCVAEGRAALDILNDTNTIHYT